MVGHHLVEDVIASLIGKLECHSGFLQQIFMVLKYYYYVLIHIKRSKPIMRPPIMRVNLLLFGYKILTRLNVSTGQFTSCTEMDSDEFTL